MIGVAAALHATAPSTHNKEPPPTLPFDFSAKPTSFSVSCGQRWGQRSAHHAARRQDQHVFCRLGQAAAAGRRLAHVCSQHVQARPPRRALLLRRLPRLAGAARWPVGWAQRRRHGRHGRCCRARWQVLASAPTAGQRGKERAAAHEEARERQRLRVGCSGLRGCWRVQRRGGAAAADSAPRCSRGCRLLAGVEQLVEGCWLADGLEWGPGPGERAACGDGAAAARPAIARRVLGWPALLLILRPLHDLRKRVRKAVRVGKQKLNEFGLYAV